MSEKTPDSSVGAHQVISIDGPAGSGKSTVARKLAKRLSFIHLNSGALFRAVAFEVASQGIASDSEQGVANLARLLSFRFVLDTQRNTVFLVGGKPTVPELWSEQTGELASVIAVLPALRDVLSSVQRDIARNSSVVVEGRDAGTVVFPSADTKFYLDADFETRARRRYLELSRRGDGTGDVPSLDEVARDLEVRDRRDETRDVAPQVAASDATIVDTSSMSVDEVVDKLVALLADS